MATLAAPPYTPIAPYTPALGSEAVAVRIALAEVGGLTYDIQINKVDVLGNILADLTPYLGRSSNDNVTRDCTGQTPSSATVDLGIDLQWGQDIIAPAILIQSDEYLGGQWQRYPLGHYVATSPDIDLTPNAMRTVTGFEKTYLLRGNIGDSYVAALGSTYASNVLALLQLAGYIPGGGLLATYAAYSGAWAAKTLPDDLPFPLTDSGQVFTYLDVVNALLAASGCRTLYCDPNGVLQIEILPVPATQPQRWVFAKTDTSFGKASDRSIVQNSNCIVHRDTFNVPNQWVFIQSGLSFQPTGTDGSNGRYVVNNLTNGPASQNAQGGRIINSTQFLNASGQTDLVAQGDAIVTALLSQAEQIDLTTASWPCAWHYDVFQYTDASLPDSNIRKVQAQHWAIPLDGSDMSWQTLVVAGL